MISDFSPELNKKIYLLWLQWILKIYISQDCVATQLRCGGIFSNRFITNFPQNVPVKKFSKSVDIWQRYGQKFVAYFFGHPVGILTTRGIDSTRIWSARDMRWNLWTKTSE